MDNTQSIIVPIKTVYNGIMIRQNSGLAESNIHFSSDKNYYGQKLKSERRKTERKNESKIINSELDSD